jgi:hypothetical protein
VSESDCQLALVFVRVIITHVRSGHSRRAKIGLECVIIPEINLFMRRRIAQFGWYNWHLGIHLCWWGWGSPWLWVDFYFFSHFACARILTCFNCGLSVVVKQAKIITQREVIIYVELRHLAVCRPFFHWNKNGDAYMAARVCRIIIAKSGIKIKTKQWPAHTNETHAYFFLVGSLKKTSIMIIGDICDACRFISLPYGDGCVSLPVKYMLRHVHCRFTTPRRECNCDKITRPFIARTTCTAVILARCIDF